MPRKLSKVEFVARALYCHETRDPNYDFEKDPKGWADDMMKDYARAAIRAIKAWERTET